jgi:hypothetical protein
MGMSRDLKWRFRAGQNIGEMRLALAFIYVPAAFIGAQKMPEINKISRGEEMRPWTLFNDYDRPICRRTLEEAGVPRHAFGQKKRASGVAVSEGLKNTMTHQSYQNFQEFLRLHEPKSLDAKLALRKLMYKLRYSNEGARRKIYSKLYYATGVRFRVPLVFPNVMPVSRESYLFHWAMQHMQAKYREAMASVESYHEVTGFNS